MTVFTREQLTTKGAEERLSAASPAVELHGVTKRFGATVANDDASLVVRYGEVHALLGANGAGKTTLMSVLFGFVRPDAGEILFEGRRVHIGSPRDALRLGVGMVRQHFSLVPQLSVAENVALGTHPSTLRRVPTRELARRIGQLALENGMDLDPLRKVERLDVDQQQAVEILKLLYRGARVLLLDEPTASLGPAQIRRLFETLSELRAGGHAVVIITHKLPEVTALADRATVMRLGRTVATLERAHFDVRALTNQMVGDLQPAEELAAAAPRSEVGAEMVSAQDHAVAPLPMVGPARRGVPPESPPAPLVVHELVVSGDLGAAAVDHLDLEVPAGCIVGLTGVEGNGQRELVEALAGTRPWRSGYVEVGGRRVERPSPARMRAAGLGVVSEDRLRWDVVPDLSVAENLALSEVARGRHARRGVLQTAALRERAEALVAEYDVQPPNPAVPLRALSGGNQQKVVIARELSNRPPALVAAQPTRGLDLRATAAVHSRLRWLKEQGGAVLLVTLDLDELFSLADRVIVLFRGRCAYEADRHSASLSDLSAAMVGGAG